MSWLAQARQSITAALSSALDVPVLEYEPRGDQVGGTWVTVRLVSATGEDVDVEVTATDVLRADRSSQDRLDALVDDIDVAVPPGVFLRDWRFDFDDTDGAVRAVGTFTAARYAGWCDPAPPVYVRGHV